MVKRSRRKAHDTIATGKPSFADDSCVDEHVIDAVENCDAKILVKKRDRKRLPVATFGCEGVDDSREIVDDSPPKDSVLQEGGDNVTSVVRSGVMRCGLPKNMELNQNAAIGERNFPAPVIAECKNINEKHDKCVTTVRARRGSKQNEQSENVELEILDAPKSDSVLVVDTNVTSSVHDDNEHMKYNKGNRSLNKVQFRERRDGELAVKKRGDAKPVKKVTEVVGLGESKSMSKTANEYENNRDNEHGGEILTRMAVNNARLRTRGKRKHGTPSIVVLSTGARAEHIEGADRNAAVGVVDMTGAVSVGGIVTDVTQPNRKKCKATIFTQRGTLDTNLATRKAIDTDVRTGDDVIKIVNDAREFDQQDVNGCATMRDVSELQKVPSILADDADTSTGDKTVNVCVGLNIAGSSVLTQLEENAGVMDNVGQSTVNVSDAHEADVDTFESSDMAASTKTKFSTSMNVDTKREQAGTPFLDVDANGSEVAISTLTKSSHLEKMCVIIDVKDVHETCSTNANNSIPHTADVIHSTPVCMRPTRIHDDATHALHDGIPNEHSRIVNQTVNREISRPGIDGAVIKENECIRARVEDVKKIETGTVLNADVGAGDKFEYEEVMDGSVWTSNVGSISTGSANDEQSQEHTHTDTQSLSVNHGMGVRASADDVRGRAVSMGHETIIGIHEQKGHGNTVELVSSDSVGCQRNCETLNTSASASAGDGVKNEVFETNKSSPVSESAGAEVCAGDGGSRALDRDEGDNEDWDYGNAGEVRGRNLRAGLGFTGSNVGMGESVSATEDYDEENEGERVETYSRFGAKMLKASGWSQGMGLGLYKQGIVEPIKAGDNAGRAGLGYKQKEKPAISKKRHKVDLNTYVPHVQDYKIIEYQGAYDPTWGQSLVQSGLESHGPVVAPQTAINYDLFGDSIVVERLFTAKTQFNGVERREFIAARRKANPYELILKGGNVFINRAAVKMANIDSMFNYIFTSPPGLSSDDTLTFADVCAGPGGFSEYVLWRREKRCKGFGFTLKGPDDFTPWLFNRQPTEPYFKTFFGKDGTGDVTNEANILAFTTLISIKTEKVGLHLMMADGGFSVEGEENYQEEILKQLVLCQFTIALSVLRQGGNFVCKIFDMFTPFTVGLVYVMYKHFNKICILKPFTSRPANSERYIICIGLKERSPAVVKWLLSVNQKLSDLGEWGVEGSDNVAHIVNPEVIRADTKFTDYVRDANVSLGEAQIIALDELMKYCEDDGLLPLDQNDIARRCLKEWNVDVDYEKHLKNQLRQSYSRMSNNFSRNANGSHSKTTEDHCKNRNIKFAAGNCMDGGVDFAATNVVEFSIPDLTQPDKHKTIEDYEQAQRNVALARAKQYGMSREWRKQSTINPMSTRTPVHSNVDSIKNSSSSSRRGSIASASSCRGSVTNVSITLDVGGDVGDKSVALGENAHGLRAENGQPMAMDSKKRKILTSAASTKKKARKKKAMDLDAAFFG
eukprot:CFRG2553T1